MGKVDRSGFVVTGAGGMIGSAVPWGRKLLRKDLDFENAAEVSSKLSLLKPKGILHLAGMDIRQCERNPALALKTNVFSTLKAAEFARDHGIPFVFLSSATVFSGPRGSTFYEESSPDPLNVYGEAKLLSEMLIRNCYPKALIVRTGWVFGGHGAHHRKFVDVAIEKAKTGQSIQASNEQEGSPTFVNDLIYTVTQLIDQQESGIWHVVNAGRATAADMAAVIVECLSSSSSVEILPNEHFQTTSAGTPARSPCEVLGSRTLELRSWKDALTEMIGIVKARAALPA